MQRNHVNQTIAIKKQGESIRALSGALKNSLMFYVVEN